MKTLNNRLQNSDVKRTYDSLIPDMYQDNYEFLRWFKNSRVIQDYVMTYRSIENHISKLKFDSCMELGPGPGTWTRILFRTNPEAVFDLVDISREMKNQFKLEMRQSPNVSYNVNDFYDYISDEKYGLFFSSRAIEYIEDTEKLCEKIVSHIVRGGTGVIVTKNPNHFNLQKIIGGKTKKHHTGQISPVRLIELLRAQGCRDIKLYPCIYRVPLLDRVSLFFSKKLFERNYRKTTLNLSRFAESYTVVFTC